MIVELLRASREMRRQPSGTTGVKEVIEAFGATVQYLPQYSPDLNPIEMPFSKFKAFLRKVSERTVRDLCRRIGSFVPTISRAECRNYFRHAGYAPT